MPFPLVVEVSGRGVEFRLGFGLGGLGGCEGSLGGLDVGRRLGLAGLLLCFGLLHRFRLGAKLGPQPLQQFHV